MKYGLKLLCVVMLPLLLMAILVLFVFVPRAALKLHGQENHLYLTLNDENGLPISNAVVRFAARQEVPIIPLPFAPTRFIKKSQSVTSDEHGIARLTWPNMSLTAQTITIAGSEIPIPSAGWVGSVVVPTPDGRSTWDVGTNYTARLVVNRSNRIVTLRPETSE